MRGVRGREGEEMSFVLVKELRGGDGVDLAYRRDCGLCTHGTRMLKHRIGDEEKKEKQSTGQLEVP